MFNTLNPQTLFLFSKKKFYKNIKSIWKNLEIASEASFSSKSSPEQLKNYKTNNKILNNSKSSNIFSQNVPNYFTNSNSLNKLNLQYKPSNFDIVSNKNLKHNLEDYKHAFSEEVDGDEKRQTYSHFSSTSEDIDRKIDLKWTELPSNNDSVIKSLLNLSKIRLTGLVATSALAGYAMAPGVFEVSTLFSCFFGVVLTSAAANSINQFFEVPYDSQMIRTMNRPIVKGTLLPHHAMLFAGTSGTAGIVLLLVGTNALTAGLGLANIVLYSLLYTPLKRTTIANTWVGSVVGAFPPVMGWIAATGTFGVGGFLMGALLYCWQFPHFCALSWNLQGDYSRAGYRMMSVVNPALCKRVSLRYSVLLLTSSFLFPICDLTTWTFALESLPPNLYLVYLAWRFYQEGDSSSSRKLFRFTLIHLPILILFMIISKKHYGALEKNSPVLDKTST